ncbi:MAG: group II intron reverse transcriptase/maturase [Peptococcaceae bacterium]|nr:group II intron reverse transcriptase/maturase [Peptococcaceae bacterium]
MAHKLDYPKSEGDFRRLQDQMYRLTKEAIEGKDLPRFKGLMEVISSETVILTAIHNIKSNHGSQTPGSDGKTMRNILEADYQDVIRRVQESLKDYHPVPVRRVYIPKPGKSEKRPLGIPAVIDRIIQECVRLVIEPILEAQFFAHSYGFRPMRDAHMALERTKFIAHKTGYHWIIEGDISKFFDNVNHTRLVKKLWHMGIRDRRVLMIIKAMLKAGIMDELKENPLGTPQGGIISPLLANAYLDTLDQWIIREWENKKTKTEYARQDHRFNALRKRSSLKPAYLIRYADDWVLITSSKSNAEKWKKRIAKYLDCKLKLTLSEEKTCITNIRKKPIHFLGFTFKVVKEKSDSGYITRTNPDPARLVTKVGEIRQQIKRLKRINPETKRGKDFLVDGINRVNSMIRGVIQYYEAATWVNVAMSKYSRSLLYTAYNTLKRHGGKWTAANEVDNLFSIHSNYKTNIPAIKYQGKSIGITCLSFCNWKKTRLKNQEETPYTHEGREKYKERTGKKPLAVRADELLTTALSEIIAKRLTGNNLYNFEYYLNRPYAFNRDKGKCRVCGKVLRPGIAHIHHIRSDLPLSQVNQVKNLASVCDECHYAIHSGNDYSFLGKKTWNKILDFRDKLGTKA